MTFSVLLYNGTGSVLTSHCEYKLNCPKKQLNYEVINFDANIHINTKIHISLILVKKKGCNLQRCRVGVFLH